MQLIRHRVRDVVQVGTGANWYSAVPAKPAKYYRTCSIF